MDSMDSLDELDELDDEARAEERRARGRGGAGDVQPGDVAADAEPTWQRGRRENEAANDVRFLAAVLKQVGEPFTIGGAAAALGYDRSSASRRILRLLALGTVTREYALNERKRGAWVYRAAAVGCDVTGVTANVRGATC